MDNPVAVALKLGTHEVPFLIMNPSKGIGTELSVGGEGLSLDFIN